MTDILVTSKTDLVVINNTNPTFVRSDSENASNIIVSGLMGPVGPQGIPGVAGGTSIQEVSSSNIGGHRVVYFNTLGQLDYADPSNLNCLNNIVGITENAAISGGNLNIVRSGKLSDSGWAWDVTKPIYLGTLGTLVQTEAVGGALLSIIVAIPKSPTEIFITIREPIVLA